MGHNDIGDDGAAESSNPVRSPGQVHLGKRAQTSIDMRMDMRRQCVGISADICADMCGDMRIEMCAGMHPDMCTVICTDMCTDMCVYMYTDICTAKPALSGTRCHKMVDADGHRKASPRVCLIC